MKQFKDFGIKSVSKALTGDKIKIERIFNREVTVLDYRIVDSRYEKGNGKCLHLQIGIGEAKHVVFTGSGSLMEDIQKVQRDDFPFKTTIVRENDRFAFT